MRNLIVIPVLLLLAGCLLTGCATNPAAVVIAGCESDAQFDVLRCAKALGGTYEIYQKRAETIVKDPSTPAKVKAKVQEFEAAATPAVVEVLRTSRDYDRISEEIKAGKGEAEQLAIVNANLDRYVNEALDRIYALIAAFSGD